MVSTESLYPFQVDVCGQVFIMALKGCVVALSNIAFAWVP